jgi:diketogulonate reductase-like aldo/keto reductase
LGPERTTYRSTVAEVSPCDGLIEANCPCQRPATCPQGRSLLTRKENQKPANSRRADFDFPVVDKERTWKILDVMAPIAKAHGCSPARLSLAWLLAKPVVTSVIIGAKRLDQLQDNLAAVELTLTQDELRQLDAVSALAPEYPGWVLALQGADRLEPVDRWERFREASSSR